MLVESTRATLRGPRDRPPSPVGVTRVRRTPHGSGEGGARSLSKRLVRTFVIQPLALAIALLALVSLAPGRAVGAGDRDHPRSGLQRARGERQAGPRPGPRRQDLGGRRDAARPSATPRPTPRARTRSRCPSPGDYTVTLDESTLPKGVTVRADTPSERTGERAARRDADRQLLPRQGSAEAGEPAQHPPPDHRQRHQVRPHHLHLRRRPLADLRHHGPVQLRPRRARGPRRHRRLVLQPVRTADPHPARGRPRHPRGHGRRWLRRRA